MALTPLQALDKFCIRMDFNNKKLPNETKVQFLARKKKEWALSIVEKQLTIEQRQTLQTEVKSLDI